MACLARLSAGMFFRVHLWKLRRLGQVRLMTSWTKHRRVGQLGNYVRGIERVLLLRSVAGLAMDGGMLASVLKLDNFAVAVFASFLARVVDGARCDFRQGIAPEVSILAETVRYQR